MMRVNVPNFQNSGLLADCIIVFVGTALASCCHMLYHLIAVRMLSAADYGTFNAIMVVILFVSMGASPFGVTLTRYFTEISLKGDCPNVQSVFYKVMFTVLSMASLLLFLFMLLAKNVSVFLHTDVMNIMICGAIVYLSLLCMPYLSFFQSIQKFSFYSFMWIIYSSLVVISGICFMKLGFGLPGALLAFFVGGAVVVVTAMAVVQPFFKVHAFGSLSAVAASQIVLSKHLICAILTMASFAIISQCDVVLVKHFFASQQASYYAMAQMIGKIALFIAFAIAVVVLPKSAYAKARCTANVQLYYSALSLSVISGIAICCISFFFPELLLKIIVGSVNDLTVSLVGWFAVFMSMCGFLWISLTFALAVDYLKIVWPLVSTAISLCAVLYFFHTDLLVIVKLSTFFSSMAFLACFLMIRKDEKVWAS